MMMSLRALGLNEFDPRNCQSRKELGQSILRLILRICLTNIKYNFWPPVIHGHSLESLNSAVTNSAARLVSSAITNKFQLLTTINPEGLTDRSRPPRFARKCLIIGPLLSFIHPAHRFPILLRMIINKFVVCCLKTVENSGKVVLGRNSAIIPKAKDRAIRGGNGTEYLANRGKLLLVKLKQKN